ncbi:hypothetical protein [Pseudonocardia pini]|uniref:hypothetical protein n=1 Tax=Pseudonocardia pini TaxID=2758030 RepID=UPI0015F0955C|nr:hypothetical protein [Pseudonocardia pini]
MPGEATTTEYRVDSASFVRSGLAAGAAVAVVEVVVRLLGLGSLPLVVAAVLGVVAGVAHERFLERMWVGPAEIRRGGWAVRPRRLPLTAIRRVDVETRAGGVDSDGPVQLVVATTTEGRRIVLARPSDDFCFELLAVLRARGVSLGSEAGALATAKWPLLREPLQRGERWIRRVGVILVSLVIGLLVGALAPYVGG